MHIKHGHEHRQLYGSCMEIFVLVDLLKRHHGAVHRRNHGIGNVATEMAARAAEEFTTSRKSTSEMPMKMYEMILYDIIT